jgi:ribosomal protein S18 acetylase RimI-like enzyme
MTPEKIREELEDPRMIFHLLYQDGVLAGYSKIVPDFPHPKLEEQKVMKLERLYLLKSFYSSGLGRELFEFNLTIARKLNQKGVWLMVWEGNERAIRFYEKAGFLKIGETYFKISERLSNPNFWMYREL